MNHCLYFKEKQYVGMDVAGRIRVLYCTRIKLVNTKDEEKRKNQTSMFSHALLSGVVEWKLKYRMRKRDVFSHPFMGEEEKTTYKKKEKKREKQTNENKELLHGGTAIKFIDHTSYGAHTT